MLIPNQNDNSGIFDITVTASHLIKILMYTIIFITVTRYIIMSEFLEIKYDM